MPERRDQRLALVTLDHCDLRWRGCRSREAVESKDTLGCVDILPLWIMFVALESIAPRKTLMG